MIRFIIAPDFFYFVVLLTLMCFARSVPVQYAPVVTAGFCFFLFLWLKEQLSLIGLKASQNNDFNFAESTLSAALFFRRIEAKLPIEYYAKLMVCDLYAITRTMEDQQRYAEALKYNDESVELAISKFGFDSVEHLSALINRGILLNHSGKSEEAEQLTESSVTKLESLKSSLSKEQAENLCLALNNLGACYIDQRKIDKALDAFDRSVSLKAEILGAGSASIAVSYGNQGYSMLKAEKFSSAEAYLRRALKLVEGTHVEPSTMATYLNNLGEALRGQGKLQEAEAELTKALQMRKSSLTPQHPHMGYSYHNLARLYADKGNNELADSYFKQAIEIRSMHPGPKNTELRETTEAYSAFLQKIGKDTASTKVEVKSAAHLTANQAGWVKPLAFLLPLVIMGLPTFLYLSGYAAMILRVPTH